MTRIFNFKRSPDTDAVADILRGCNADISYADIAHRSRLTVERAKAILPSARRVLRKEGILFGVITNFGVRRLTDSDKAVKPEAFKRRVVRGANRELKDLSTISNFNGLSPQEQHGVTINRTLLHSMKQTAKVKPGEPQTQYPQSNPNVAAIVAAKG